VKGVEEEDIVARRLESFSCEVTELATRDSSFSEMRSAARLISASLLISCSRTFKGDIEDAAV
jgi:hypothetical protein